MALPALLGAGARAVGGSMVKSGGKAVAGKVLGRGRKKQAQPGRIIPGREGVDGGKGGAIIKPKVKMVSAKEIKSLQTGDTVSPGKDPLKSIYSNVILIEKILKGTNIADRDSLKEQKKNDKKADKSDQEKKLETKPPKIDKKKGEVMKLPETGVFGWIKNFIGNILMGYFAVRLIKYLPQMMGLLKGLGHVVDFVTDVGMFLVDGMATFIDFAYNVYDGTRNIMKGIGLEGAFDSIMKAMEVAITVLTFALGAKSLGGFGDSRGGKGKPGRGKPQTRIAGPKGNLLGSQDRVTSTAAARRYANRFGRDAAEKRFGKDAVSGLGGKFGRSRVTNFARGAATGIAKKLGGRQGVKMLASLGKIGKFLKVPVIGSIISVVISLMNGDPIQKALFKGVGTAVGGALGGFLSTFIGVPPLGLFLGGIIGDYVGDLLYTLFFGGGLKEAGAKLGNDLKGLFMGIGDGIKAIFSWVFGGGLLDLLKNVGGGLLKFAGYILNPGGLLWDMLKAGGAVVGAITNFLFGGGLLDLIKNVGGGVLKFIGYILMPNGLLFDALKAGGAAAKMIFDFAKSIVGNVVGGAVEGTKRVAGGFFDALTFNLFDFDKQNKVETKKSGGEVGRGLQEDTLKQQKKALRKKPSYSKIEAPEGGKIKTGKKTERAYWDFLGWARTGGEEETMQLGVGGQMLANRVINVGNSFGEHPYFGPILSLAAKVILGETPSEEEYKNIGYGLNMLVGDGVAKGKIGEGIKGYEDGGMIDDYYALADIDIGRWATDTFKKELSDTLNKNFDPMKSSAGSTAGPGTAAGERDSATGALVPGTGTSGTPFSGSMKGAQIGEQHLLDAMKKFNYKGDPAVLMAIVKGESKFQAKEELMYSDASNAYSVFSDRFNSIEHAQQLIDSGKKAFFDHVYQPKYVPMNEKPDDGYRYIGRGHIQLTGRSNYRQVGEVIGRDLEGDPMSILNDPIVSAEAAVGFMINANERYNKDINSMEGSLRTVGGYKGGWPAKREYYQEYKQKIASGQIGQNTPATPDVQPSQSGQQSGQPSPEQSGQTGKGSEAAQKLLKDFPQIKTRGSSQQIYASGLGHYLKTVGAGRGKGIGDYGDPAGSTDQMEHPDHGGVVASHAGTGHYRGVALDLGANSATSKSYQQDQKNLWPHISKFLHKYGLHKDPYVPQVIHGPKESFSPKAASSFADGAHHNHFHVEFHKGGLVGGDGEVPALLKSGEIVIDNDSSISKVAPMLLAINKAKDEKGVMNAIRNYAPYEAGAQQTIMIQDPPQQMPEESPQSSGGGMMVMSGGSSHDPFEFLDYQG